MTRRIYLQIVAVATTHPPCFFNRDSWIQYLKSKADANGSYAEGRMFVKKEGEPVRLNPFLRFCDDCFGAHEEDMKKQGRCKPRHLRDIDAKEKKELKHAT